MKFRLPIPQADTPPAQPKFPTADFAHEMAATVVAARKRGKKDKDTPMVNGVSLEVC